jgi:hypothetical protein
MKIEKAQWSTDGETFTIGMPLQKVDKENRLVSGWASLDNPDLQGDIVLAEASEKAFSRFRGNIREMHQPIAVGRMVDYKPEQYYDPITQKFYNGIYVTVRVSKGAESTWEKVLDGTLQAFSIKGPIRDSERQFSKDAGKPLRIVKDYDLEELSLVDSGGNQYCNIASIVKGAGMESVLKGDITETSSVNVFYCSQHEGGIAKTSTEESAVCLEGHTMENIGWFEYENNEDISDKVQKVIDSHTAANVAKQEVPATNEGGVDVAEEVTKTEETEVVPGSTAPAVDAVAEEGKAESEVDSSNEEVANNAEVAAGDEEKPAEVEKAADVSEVVVEEPDFAKMFGDLQTAITASLEKSVATTTEAIGTVNTNLEAKISELTAKNEELTQKFNSVTEELATVAKRVESVEADTAVKKSGDLGGSTEDTLTKSKGSKWGGHFLSTTDL